MSTTPVPTPQPPAWGAVMEKKKLGVSNTPYDGGPMMAALRWRPVGNRWRLVGNRWRLVCNRWRLVGNRWRLVCNRWRLVGNRWRLVCNRWRLVCNWVTDGGWCVTDGGWCVTDGGWRVATKHQRVDAIVKEKKRVSVLMAPPGGPSPAPPFRLHVVLSVAQC